MCITEKPVSRDRKGNQLEIYKIGVCRMQEMKGRQRTEDFGKRVTQETCFIVMMGLKMM